MLVNIHHDSPQEHRRLVIAGAAFLLVIAMMIGLSIAVYQKTFEPVTMVTIKADRAGLQLAKFGDVRINGVLVGQVREISQDGKEASIKVGIKPDAAKNIPGNVTVEILPTTLFGQKFVSFVRPTHPSGSLHDGQVIPSSRVETNVELSRILANLFPLLRSIKPADLNATLNALATALAGRGENLGETMIKLKDYLGAIDDELPTLRRDLDVLADVADTYDLAAPDLLRTLKSLTVTGTTVVDQAAQLEVFFSDLTGLADTSSRILEENETNLIRIGQVTAPIVNLLAVYSPEFPCLLRGLDRYTKNLNEIFEGGRVKQYVELGAVQREGYEPDDRPVYGEIGHGPWCLGLPYPKVPIPSYTLNDGDDRSIDPTSPLNILTGAKQARMDMGYAGTEADQQLIRALMAAESGRSIDEYGSVSTLVYGPLVKGQEASG
jgi:phospholipid/cholesterol/gamma-HCH transport system substrate-binding protein